MEVTFGFVEFDNIAINSSAYRRISELKQHHCEYVWPDLQVFTRAVPQQSTNAEGTTVFIWVTVPSYFSLKYSLLTILRKTSYGDARHFVS